MIPLFAFVAVVMGVQLSAQALSPAITIYNQNFAVVRVDLPLDLKKGVQQVSYDGATAHIETDSVVLRDPSGKVPFQILEQNYEANVMSQALLLSLNEGKTIEFLMTDPKGSRTIPGKVIRSGYQPHAQGMRQYDQRYYANQMSYTAIAGEPIIEIEGKLRFGLPGTPLFPPLSDSALLKPILSWSIESPASAKFSAELAYITGGMSWEATYNLVSPEKGSEVDLTGWITVDNQSGRDFEAAKVKLMAGDVAKIQEEGGRGKMQLVKLAGGMDANMPTVTEKAFDEFHLYSLARPTTLKDRETKQVEFIRASQVQSEQIYLYDGAAEDRTRYRGWDPNSLRQDQNVGTRSQPKVWAMRELKNSKANQLGVPLPKGKLRFYRRDDDGRLEFTGENLIDHTPKDETVRVYTGNAFDLLGERKRTNYQIDVSRSWIDESFEIRLKNRKDSDVEIRVAEYLYRWVNWKITAKNHPFSKTNSQVIEFKANVPKNSEKVITYTVHYSW